MTAASAVDASPKQVSSAREATCSCVAAKRARTEASKAASWRNHCSGAVSSNQKRKTSLAQGLPGRLLSVEQTTRAISERTATARVQFRYLVGLAGDAAGFAIAAGASSMVRTTLEVGRSGPTAAPFTSPFTASSQRASVVTAVLALGCTTL